MPHWLKAFAFLLVWQGALVGQQYRFDSYDQSNGLSNLQIHSIAFDREGFLWIATLNGIVRFLGSRFEHYGPAEGIAERQVEDVYVDGQGRVWAATGRTLYLWRARRFQPVKSAAGPIGFVEGLVTADRDRLIFLREGRLVEATLSDDGAQVALKPLFSSAQRIAHPELDHVVGLAKTRDETIWTGCGTEICSYQAGKLRVWGPGNGVPRGYWANFCMDLHGDLWARAADRVLQLRAHTVLFENRSPPGIASSKVFRWRSILEDRFGRILLNSDAGLERWDGSSWRTIGPANGLNETATTSLARDPGGDIWIGTLRGLWHWVGYENWESWTEAQGLPSSGIWSLDPIRGGEVLIGTIKGPARLNPRSGSVEVFSNRKLWPWAQVSGIGQDKSGAVWISTFAGSILKGDAHLTSIRSVENLMSFTSRLWVATNGDVWIVTDKGVHVVDTSTSEALVSRDLSADASLGGYSPQISLAPAVSNIVSADVWISMPHKVIFRRAGRWESLATRGLSLEKIKIQEVSEAPNGTLFICGLDQSNITAVWRIEKARDGRLQASSIALPLEFRALLPLAILGDSRGWMWLGTDNGLLGWNGAQWRMFSQESGLIFNDVNRSVLREAPDGSIWIGTSKGAAHLMNVETIFDRVSIPLEITTLEANGLVTQGPDAGDLAWARNRLRFQFSSPATWNRSTLLFKYRILGLDSAWISTKNNDAEFSNLPPGSYRFQVFALNPSNGSSSRVLESAFKVLPPWWRTWWFYTGCAAASVLLIWLLLRMRTKQLQIKQRNLERTVQQMWAETHRLAERAQDATLAEERNRLAHELHDSLAASFTAIFMQLQAASDLAANGDDRSYACVARAEELSRKGLQHVREFAQSLIARSDQPPPTTWQLREFVTFATLGTSVAGSFDVQGRERLLKPACALALARILLEAVGNAQRYARSKTISVTLSFEARFVRLTIQDDGIGFRVDRINERGFGMAGMRARAVRLSGTFEVKSSPGNGTEVVVDIPDPYDGATTP